MNMGFVIALGLVTVFVCLIMLIAIIYIMGAIINKATAKTAPAAAPAPVAAAPVAAAPVAAAPAANKQQLVAAMAAVIAEEMGTDVNHIRIHSIKKI